MKTALFLRAAVPVALATAALLSGPAGAQTASTSSDTSATVTREDVMRDLATWKPVGLEKQLEQRKHAGHRRPRVRRQLQKYVDTVKPRLGAAGRTQ